MQLLREFRDVYLLTTRPGRRVVDVYYRLSPALADIIREHDLLRMSTQVALTPVVWAVQLGMGRAEWRQYMIAGCFLLGIPGCGWLVMRRRIHLR